MVQTAHNKRVVATLKKKKGARTKQSGKTVAQTVPKKEAVGLLGEALRTIGGFGGSVAGGWLGNSSRGGEIGRGLGASLSKWMGAGDYKVSKNSVALGGVMPSMHSNNMAIVVRHKEYIMDIVSSSSASTFSAIALSLNPGLASSFPYLAQLAQNFQEYSIKGMVFEFKSTSADSIASSTNTTLGSVMIATQYNAADPQFTNKQQLLNEEYSNDSKPSEDFCHPIECARRENPFAVQYIRGSAVPAGQDVKMYDLGTTSVATTGFQGTNVVCGELWCSYEVELRKPAISSGLNLYGRYAHYSSKSAASSTFPFGTGGFNVIVDTLQPSANYISTVLQPTNISLPVGLQGSYFVMFTWGNACTAIAFSTAFTYTGCSALVIGSNWQANNVYSAYSAGTFFATYVLFITIPDPTVGAVITSGTCTTLNGTPKTDIFVMQVPGSLAAY